MLDLDVTTITTAIIGCSIASTILWEMIRRMCFIPVRQPLQIWASWELRQALAKYIQELLATNGYKTFSWTVMIDDHYPSGSPERDHECVYLTIDGTHCDHKYTWIYINSETIAPIQIIWGQKLTAKRTTVTLDPENPNLFDQILELMPKRIPLWKIPYYRLLKKV